MNLIFIEGTLIFVFTYILITIKNIFRKNIPRSVSSLLGAGLMIIFGIVPFYDVIQSINIGIILLLFGMMSIVGIFGSLGFFDWIAFKLINFSNNSRNLLILLSLITAILSAFFLNDAVVLFFSPIVIKIINEEKLNPSPYILSLIFSANIGSVATEIGNPQNAYIGLMSKIPFFYYFERMFLVSLISLFISIIFLYLYYRKDMNITFHKKEEEIKIKNKPLTVISISAVILMIILMIILNNPDSLFIIPFVSSSILLFVYIFSESSDPRKIIRDVDWNIIMFFIGLFIVLQGIIIIGIPKNIENIFSDAGLSFKNPYWYTAFVAIISNLVSNVPAVLLIGSFTTGTNYWLDLAMSSTLAGNMTVIGAAANLIVLEIATLNGIEISWKEFLKIGIPLSIVTIIAGTYIIFI
ncbi:MAG: SLC13 family permease [Thermoplasmata archaeon]